MYAIWIFPSLYVLNNICFLSMVSNSLWIHYFINIFKYVAEHDVQVPDMPLTTSAIPVTTLAVTIWHIMYTMSRISHVFICHYLAHHVHHVPNQPRFHLSLSGTSCTPCPESATLSSVTIWYIMYTMSRISHAFICHYLVHHVHHVPNQPRVHLSQTNNSLYHCIIIFCTYNLNSICAAKNYIRSVGILFGTCYTYM